MDYVHKCYDNSFGTSVVNKKPSRVHVWRVIKFYHYYNLQPVSSLCLPTTPSLLRINLHVPQSVIQSTYTLQRNGDNTHFCLTRMLTLIVPDIALPHFTHILWVSASGKIHVNTMHSTANTPLRLTNVIYHALMMSTLSKWLISLPVEIIYSTLF